MSASLSRRELLLGAGLAAAGVAGVATSKGASPRDGSVVAGTLEQVLPAGQIDLQTQRGPIRVTFARTAGFWRDRPVALAAFVPGDEVVAEGIWSEDVFVSTYLMSMFRPVAGRVVEADDTRVVTTGGAVRITGDTKTRSAETWTPAIRATFVPGEDLAILSRRDPATGELVAVSIFRNARF